MTKILRNLVLLLFVVAAVFYFSSCEKYQYPVPKEYVPVVDTSTTNPAKVVSFKKSVEPVFVANGCTICHKSGKSPDLRTGYAYASLKNGGFVDKPASTSKLYVKITKDASHSAMLPQAPKDTIYIWIEQGSKDN
jgi:hypothetical protein